MIRGALRWLAEVALGSRVAGRRIQSRHGGDILVLAFHNVVPDDAPALGDHSLHLRLSTFTGLLDRLCEICSPVDIVRLSAPESLPGFAVTFDDAYRGALLLAIPELVRRGIPATVFVPTALMGDRDFWWDALADSRRGLDPALRVEALERLQGADGPIRAWAAANGCASRVMPKEWRSGTIEELRFAALSPGVTLALHSMTHRALDRLEGGALREELEEPLKWFAENRLPFRRVLAYPYGRCSPAVRAAAHAAGYEQAWLVSGGWETSADTDRLTLPRLNIPGGASIRGGMLRAAEFIPG